MLRIAHYAPALIGLALVAPATARAQSHSHSAPDCEACMAARHASPVVEERNGIIGRLRGGDRVSIPTGHHVNRRGEPMHAHAQGNAYAPASNPSWGNGSQHLSYEVGHDAETGYANLSPGHAVPSAPYGAIASGEPMPIGEMRTSYVTPMSAAVPTAPAAMPNAASMNGGFTGVPVIPPNPAIEAWHQNRLPDRVVPRRSGPLETMLGTSSLMNWVEKRKTLRAMRASAKQGAYAPSMHQMPGWAVDNR
ncbi:hypothetical protein [Tautonia marina]|uniref:hypothetical protein n=1 Tax=Tautonia marina TaxID=2653855 RepID=UPI0013754370|nr:hypothetical protein [Tautonia marina]